MNYTHGSKEKVLDYDVLPGPTDLKCLLLCLVTPIFPVGSSSS